MQALHLLALVPVAETTGDPNSYGFRSGRSTADAIEQCFRVLEEKFSATQKPSPKVNLIRYADDFIITGTSKELLEGEVKPWVEQSLRDRAVLASIEG